MIRQSAPRVGHGLTWAKTILIGEHSVVYGHPAVALPLPGLRMRATVRPTDGPSRLRSLGYDGTMSGSGPQFACVKRAFDAARAFSGCLDQSFEVTTVSDFPHQRGLGSSAASAGAVIRAVLDAVDRHASADELLSLTHLAEQVAHEHPSGLDAAATSATSPIRFQSGEMRAVAQRIEGAHLVVADSGVHGSTREAVGGLRRRYEEAVGYYGPRISHLGELTQVAVRALASGDAAALGSTMDEAHATLAEIGVSLRLLDSLAAAARGAGALGAKMTGGGLGGCLIALTDSPAATDRVSAALVDAGATRTWTYQMRTSEAAA